MNQPPAIADTREWLPLRTKARTVAGQRIVLLGAADYSGIGAERLCGLAKDPDSPIVGYIDKTAPRGNSRGEWWFLKSSLDDLRAGQAGQADHRALLNDARQRLGL